MLSLLKKYKGFIIGLPITYLLKELLESIDFIRIDESEVLVNILLFSFWWLVISLPIHKFELLKRHRLTVLKILILGFLLIVTVVQDTYLDIPDNPISIFLIVSFWISVFYILAPSFFLKYRYYIIGIYVLIFGYWTYVRLFSESFEYYLNHEKGFAFTLMMLPIPLFLTLWVYEQWKWLKSLKAGKSEAELALLKSQVNPHFFFNTLNNLYSLTVKKSEEAPQVVLKLSDMMRYTIYEGKKDFVPIHDEIDYLNNYIDLHKIRYHKTVDIQFKAEVQERDEVAPLLFIILLENAFKHGVESLSSDAFIKMNLISDKDKIFFTIANNFEAPNKKNVEDGIGLENLKRRLELIYPKRHTLAISSQNNVFRVELKIEKL